MSTADVVSVFIQRAIPDDTVTVMERTGTMDHLRVRVVSDLFKDQSLLDRHLLVYQALDAPMKDGRIHALEIKAETTDGG